jgi:hypothetical protein
MKLPFTSSAAKLSDALSAVPPCPQDLGERPSLHAPARRIHQKENDRDNEGKKEEDSCSLYRRSRKTPKPEQSGNERDDQKDDCPMQQIAKTHGLSSPSFQNFSTLLILDGLYRFRWSQKY